MVNHYFLMSHIIRRTASHFSPNIDQNQKTLLPQTALEECNGYLKADFEGSLGCRGVTVPLDVDTMYMYPIVNFVITQVEIIAD